VSRRYVVMTSAGHSVNGYGWAGRYRNVAICLIEGETPPKMISPRAKGMIHIVREWRGCYVGYTEKSHYARARLEAEALAAKLNNELD
jgi:hypothetical protein